MTDKTPEQYQQMLQDIYNLCETAWDGDGYYPTMISNYIEFHTNIGAASYSPSHLREFYERINKPLPDGIAKSNSDKALDYVRNGRVQHKYVDGHKYFELDGVKAEDDLEYTLRLLVKKGLIVDKTEYDTLTVDVVVRNDST